MEELNAIEKAKSALLKKTPKSLIIRKSDLSNEAQDLGIWNTLLEMANLGGDWNGKDDDIDIEIIKVDGKFNFN